jgi:hypothetical protein
MEENERSYLAKLPEEITVYRGCRRKNDCGLSWTTDREVAEWFANRFAFRNKLPGYVFTGTVKHNEILAAFTDDGIASEEEIVSDCVHIVRVEQASSERAALYQEQVSQAHKEFWEPLRKKAQAAARAA